MSRLLNNAVEAVDAVASFFYHDREFKTEAVKILPNEYYVTTRPMVLTTVLGSCVAACLRDPVTGIGGMNHFMLPDEQTGQQREEPRSMRYGTYAMEVLIDRLVKAGADRNRLEAKVFGGGAVLGNMTQLNVGERNAEFVLRYMQQQNIRVVAQDLKGQHPRRVNYFPDSGKVLVRKLARSSDAEDLARQEQQLLSAMLLRDARLVREANSRHGREDRSLSGMTPPLVSLRRVI